MISTVVETPVSSVDSDVKVEGVKVFPNPAHGALYLRGAIVPGSIVEVRNMPGELVMSWRHERSGDAESYLEALPAGKYLLNVSDSGGTRGARDHPGAVNRIFRIVPNKGSCQRWRLPFIVSAWNK